MLLDEKWKKTPAFLVFITILPIYFTVFCTILFFKATKLKNTILKFCLEYILIVCPIVLCVTVLFTLIIPVVFGCFVVTVIAACFVLKDMRQDRTLVLVPTKQLGYVTLCRAATYLITSVCILAVDFRHFPRALAKTRNYGSSLMDTGIGLFVFVSGIVCKEKPINRPHELKVLIKTTIPLLVIGIARTIVISALNYGQNVTEYGVHWNAFITLATTRVFGYIVAGCVRDKKYLGYAAVLVATIHEILLQFKLEKYIMDPSGSRIDFVDANREGIFSIPGYVALYLASIHVGIILNGYRKPIDAQKLFDNASVLALACCLLWGTTFFLECVFQISRRVVNSGYITWILAIGLTMTTLFMILEYLLATSKTNRKIDANLDYVPTIMEAVNYNGLAFFLLSNFLTGFVNMTLSPHGRDLTTCLIILFVYMFILCQTAVVLYKKKIKIKL